MKTSTLLTICSIALLLSSCRQPSQQQQQQQQASESSYILQREINDITLKRHTLIPPRDFAIMSGARNLRDMTHDGNTYYLHYKGRYTVSRTKLRKGQYLDTTVWHSDTLGYQVTYYRDDQRYYVEPYDPQRADSLYKLCLKAESTIPRKLY